MKKDTRQHIDSGLAAESLVDRKVIAGTGGPEILLLPDLWLIAVGGSVFDAGADPLKKLAGAVVDLVHDHEIAISCGGGVRERHTLKIGLGLGLPTGGLATVAGSVPEQNALIFWALLTESGGVRLPKAQLEMLPTMLALKRIPVLTSNPPYEYWEFPPVHGSLPPHGCDCGALLLAETLGCRLLLLKDVQGICSDDPKHNSDAGLIDRVDAKLLASGAPDTLPLEPAFAGLLANCRRVGEIRLINGLNPAPLERCLAGEPVGTLIETVRA